MDENKQTTNTEIVENTEEVMEENKKKKRRWLWLLLLLLLLIPLRACPKNKPIKEVVMSTFQNILPENGLMTQELSAEELESLKAGLIQKVKEGEIAFRVNASPVFRDGRLNIRFESPGNNVNLLSFQIMVDEKEVYNSNALLPPNSHIEDCKISSKLKKGTHSGMVIIHSYNTETKEYKGSTRIKININSI